MNIKLHTPKSLKAGSGMATMKQFLLSLLATSVSIILTFGTAALVESHKKEAAKREIVMMILYDLSSSIREMEKADSTLRAGFKTQLAVAENPKLFEDNPFIFARYAPHISYTQTVENIFSSNIETINTIGNVFFAENVSYCYEIRKKYRHDICDTFIENNPESHGITEYRQALELNYSSNIFLSGQYLNDMKEKMLQCQQMMDVSDADLETYQDKRLKMAKDSKSDSTFNALLQEMAQNNKLLQQAVQKGGKQE